MNYFYKRRSDNNGVIGKINAPTMAYLTVYGKMPNPPIYGKEASHKTYYFNGIPIDNNIPRDSINKLFKMKYIETRASCEGDSDRHLTFLIFRLSDKNISNKIIEKIVKDINLQNNYKSHWDIGQSGFPRICVSEKLWYSKENEKIFLNWWKNLPNIIEKCITKELTINNIVEQYIEGV